jgi:hypothetical protein
LYGPSVFLYVIQKLPFRLINELTLGRNMKIQESIHANFIRQLLVMISAICFLVLTGCSSIDAGVGKGFHNAFIRKMDPQPNEDAVAANRDSMEIMPTVFDPISTR